MNKSSSERRSTGAIYLGNPRLIFQKVLGTSYPRQQQFWSFSTESSQAPHARKLTSLAEGSFLQCMGEPRFLHACSKTHNVTTIRLPRLLSRVDRQLQASTSRSATLSMAALPTTAVRLGMKLGVRHDCQICIPGTYMPSPEYLSHRDVASIALWLDQTLALSQNLAIFAPPGDTQ